MSTAGDTVAIVPAKLSSVRLPRKNLADLGGLPLFHYSVRAAQLCTRIDAVYVSSEAAEVCESARSIGAEVIERPPGLSRSEVTNLDVLRHALTEVTDRRGNAPELVVLLQPTHPLRQHSEIDLGISRMQTNDWADTLLTVVPAQELRGTIEAGRFVPEFPLPRDKSKEPCLYRNTGSFYIFRVENTLARGRMYSEAIFPFELEHPEFEVDIDEASDLAMARCLLDSHREMFAEFLD